MKKQITFVHSESESFAIESLSSLLKNQGHQVSLAFDPQLFDSSEVKNQRLRNFFDIKDILIKQVIETKPDLVGFSVFTYNYQWALKMAREIKARIDVPVIFGGIHPTLVPEVVIKNDCVDMLCVGDGEEVLLELVKNLRNSRRYKIKNLWLKKDGKIIKNEARPTFQDLDALPLPDKELFAQHFPIYNSGYGLMAGRGCPFNCTFCCANILRRAIGGDGGHFIRKRSVDNVISELVWAKKKFKPFMVQFIDDVFITDINWLKDFARKYQKRIGLPFNCAAHPAVVSSEMVRTLKKAGCNLLTFGVQSASEKVRRELLGRWETNNQIRKAAQICKKEGLKFTFDHILNLPFEKIDDLIEAVDFYNEVRPTIINTFLLTYYPKAEITSIAFKAKLLTKKDVQAISNGKNPGTYSLSFGKRRGLISRKNRQNYYQFIFWLTILPLLPRFLVQKVIKRGWLYYHFSAPVWLIVLIKFLIRIKIGRAIDTIYIIKLLIKRMFINFKLKYFLAPGGEIWWRGYM